MSGETILIEQLRADVERLTAERDSAIEQAKHVGSCLVECSARAGLAERERDEAVRVSESLRSRANDERAKRDEAVRERDEARSERDARPDISAEDAELFSRTSHTVSQTIEDRIPGYADAMSRIASALQGHAEKAVKS